MVLVIPAKAGIQRHLKLRCNCQAASRAALPSQNDVVGFRLQASYFLAAAPKSNQKAPPPDNCAPHRKSTSAMRGALRSSLVAGSADRPSLA